jgi:PAS domain S-box-containing protein
MSEQSSGGAYLSPIVQRHLTMTKEVTQRLSIWLGALSSHWALIVFVLCSFMASAAVYQIVVQLERQRANASLEVAAQKLISQLNLTLLQYEHTLTGAVGLFKASEQVNEEEWQQYFSEMVDDSRQSPLISVGYAEQDLMTEETQKRTQAKIQFIEPRNSENRYKKGRNLMRDDAARIAMLMARDEGLAKASKYDFVDSDIKASHLLVYFPIYQNGAEDTTLSEKQSAFLGWIFAEVDMTRLLLNNRSPLFSVYLSHEDDSDRQTASASAWKIQSELAFIDQSWQVLVVSKSGQHRHMSEMRLSVYLVFGLCLFNLMLVAALYALYRTRRELRFKSSVSESDWSKKEQVYLEQINNAEATIERETAYMESVPDAIVVANDEGLIVRANSAAHSLFEYEQGALLGIKVEELMPESIRLKHRAMRRYFQSDPKTRLMDDGNRLTALTDSGEEKSVTIDIIPCSLDRERNVMAVIREVRPEQAGGAALSPVMEQSTIEAKRLSETEQLIEAENQTDDESVNTMDFNSERIDSLTRGKANRIARVSTALKELIEQGDAPIAKALSHIAAGDNAQAKFEVHSMKGAVANYGAVNLAAILARFEKAILGEASQMELEALVCEIRESLSNFSSQAQLWIDQHAQ